MPILFATFLLKYDNNASVTAVVDNRNRDDENTIFLSNSVKFSCD